MATPAISRELRPHQADALRRLKNGSVLVGGVGSGKTTTALAYYAQIVCEGVLDRTEPMRRPKTLIIITTAKKRDELDWEGEALHYGIFPNPEHSYSGKEMIVDSWNNITKYVNREDCFFIFDEQRVPGAGAWVRAFLKIVKHNEWILLSATPADTWLDYVPLFLANGFFRTRTEFMEEHVVWQLIGGRYRKIRGYYGVSRLKAYRDQILVEMPYEKHTVRHLLAEEVEYDVETFNKVWRKRWNVYEDCPLVDSAEMHRVARKVVNSDPSRLDAIERLNQKHGKMIIFYNFDYELEQLRTLGTKLDIYIAEWNGHRHEPVPTDEHRWIYLVQYQAGAEGWNCITTDAIVFYSLTYSHKLFEQAQGRIDRMNTPFVDLYYYILMSESRIDKLIWRAIVLKRNFHEGRVVKYNQAARILQRN